MPPTSSSRLGPQGGQQGDQQLILTPSKLRLNSTVFAIYATGTWLMHALFIVAVIFKADGYAFMRRVPWAVVFAPEFAAHLAQVPLFAFVIARRAALVEQQLGPPPPAGASPGLVVVYASIRAVRARTAAVDAGCALVESVAVLAVKVIVAALLDTGAVAAGAVCWRLVLLPVWVAWPVTAAASWWLKAPSERVGGSLFDLAALAALLAALRLDGAVTFAWRVALLVQWLWFGALLVAALAALGFVAAALACARTRCAGALVPVGVLGLLTSAAAQLPGWVLLSRRLDGDAAVSAAAALSPMACSWFGMWVSALVISAGLARRERLRAALAAAGQTWTSDPAVAARVARLDCIDARGAVERMTDAQLARLARALMRHKDRPAVLTRIGDALWRRAASPDGVPLSDGIATAASLQLSVPSQSSGGGRKDKAAAGQGGCADAADTDEAADATVIVLVDGGGGRSGNGAGAQAPTTQQQQLQQQLQQPRFEGAGATAVASAGPRGGGTDQWIAPRLQPQPQLELCQARLVVAGANPNLEPSSTSQPRQQQQQQQQQPQGSIGNGDDDDGDGDEGLCTICCDRPASCVFMECGHGGYCWRCAHVLYARPPNECPACRRRIEMVVQVAGYAGVGVGRAARVLSPQLLGGAGGAGAAAGRAGARALLPACLRPLSPVPFLGGGVASP